MKTQETTNNTISDGDQPKDLISRTVSKDAIPATNKDSNTKSVNEFDVSQSNYRHNRRFHVSMRVPKRVFKDEKELAPDGSERIYSKSSTNGKVYLAKISHDHDPLQPIKKEANLQPLKYPPMNNFLTKKGFRTIMILHNYEMKKLARLGGKMIAAGFNPLSKSNPTVWPYPCSRPFFKTCWLYRTLSARTLACIALQLRIFWCSLRWDDMIAKPPTNNGKIVTNTDTGIVSTEILKHRIRGRFSERNDYLRLTLLIPYGYADPQPNRGTYYIYV